MNLQVTLCTALPHSSNATCCGSSMPDTPRATTSCDFPRRPGHADSQHRQANDATFDSDPIVASRTAMALPYLTLPCLILLSARHLSSLERLLFHTYSHVPMRACSPLLPPWTKLDRCSGSRSHQLWVRCWHTKAMRKICYCEPRVGAREARRAMLPSCAHWQPVHRSPCCHLDRCHS